MGQHLADCDAQNGDAGRLAAGAIERRRGCRDCSRTWIHLWERLTNRDQESLPQVGARSIRARDWPPASCWRGAQTVVRMRGKHR